MATDANWAVRVHSPLGPDKLLLRRMTAVEQISRPFVFRADLMSKDHAIKLENLLGNELAIEVDLPNRRKRYFHGLVSRFDYIGAVEDHVAYYAEIRPKMWFLDLAQDCRIFHEQTVPDIVRTIFEENGISDFKFLQGVPQETGSFRKWEYCVQYREHTLRFIQRLLEQEGIFYYFRHYKDRHEVLFGYDTGDYDQIEGYDSVPYLMAGAQAVEERDYIVDWTVSKHVQTGMATVREFDIANPSANLEAKLSKPGPYAESGYEKYDYPGEYKTNDVANAVARQWLEEEQSDYELATGKGDVGGLAPGCVFKLSDFEDRTVENRPYLCLATTLEIEGNPFEFSGTGGGGAGISECRLSAMDANHPYRPPRITERPVIDGLQTATVVAPENEEIHPDELLCIKVHFHWDRDDKEPEKRCCWVPVAQIWASKNYGAQFLPRADDEVVIAFLEGDPDRPLCIGSVYTGTNKPPFPLPQNKTRSGIKTRSSKQGTADNSNHIYFEDEKGKEEINIHAERNLVTSVEASETRTVGASRTTTIEKDETLTIKKGDRTETLEEGSDSLTISKGDRNADILEGIDVLFVQQGDIEQSAPMGVFRSSTKTVHVDATQAIDILTGASSIKMTPSSVEIVCGASSIKMTPASIDIVSPMVKINS